MMKSNSSNSKEEEEEEEGRERGVGGVGATHSCVIVTKHWQSQSQMGLSLTV